MGNVKQIFLNIKRKIKLTIYYSFLIYLPKSNNKYLGRISKLLRYNCCKGIFKQCGKNVNIEKGAKFGSGSELIIGDYSGIGINASVPFNLTIGNHVMMGPEVMILGSNHSFTDIKTPMMYQPEQKCIRTIIESDIWIGAKAIIVPGRIIRQGSVIAAGCVLTKDFPSYSVIGGNPSKLIKQR